MMKSMSKRESIRWIAGRCGRAAGACGVIGWGACLAACAEPALVPGPAQREDPTPAAAFRIDADYPGGNIVVERIQGRTVWVAPDQRDTVPNQWWFYFSFRLRAPAQTPVAVVFTGRNPLGVRGPAVSIDGGAHWRWMGAGAVRSSRGADGRPAWSFDAEVPAGASEARYAFCPPYLESHLKAWLDRHRDHPNLAVETLVRSRAGRPVEMLRAGCLDRSRSAGVVIVTSRHHCCEAMATYALEGCLEAVLADDEAGRQWRKAWELVAIPFMDKDGVEAGDQGKYRAPHDHNRDYIDAPLYPEVAALMERGRRWGDCVRVFLDLHCPHIRGEWNDRAYFVGSPEPEFWEREKAFAAVLERVQEGPIRFRAEDCLAYGLAWNRSGNDPAGRSSSAWARSALPRAALVASMEIAYADALGIEVNAESARALGRDLGRALAAYLAAAGGGR